MKDFITYELAVKLKEKGYPQHICDYAYIIEDDYEENKCVVRDREYISFIPDYLPTIAAPVISQVLKWLREEKKISIEIGIHCLLKWMCSIYAFSDGIEDFTQYDNDGINDTIYILYNSYEQAALAGIEYVLDNLI